MVKEVMLVVSMALLLVAGCNSTEPDSNRIRVWLSTDESTMIRGGYLVDPNGETEIGGEFSWFDCEENEPRTAGVYAMRHLPSAIAVQNPFSIEGWPETLDGYPYFGMRLYRDFELGASGFAPFAGVRMPPFFIEGRANANEPEMFMIGASWDF